MVRMDRMFGMFVLRVFFLLIMYLMCVSHVFQSVMCVTCDTSVVMDFSLVSSSLPFQSRRLQGNEGRCIN